MQAAPFWRRVGPPLTDASPPARYHRGGRDWFAECSPVRDLVSDWNKWSRGERLLAIVVTFVLAAALPLGLLLNAHPGG